MTELPGTDWRLAPWTAAEALTTRADAAGLASGWVRCAMASHISS